MKDWEEGDTCYYWGKSEEAQPKKGTVRYLSIIEDTCLVESESGEMFYTSRKKIYTLQEIYERKMQEFYEKYGEAKIEVEWCKVAISDLQRYYEKEINK